MKRWWFIPAGVLLAMVASLSGGQQPVEFARERIAVNLDGTAIAVDGDYVLRNPAGTDRVQKLYYPFPVDSTHPFPDSISVWRKRAPVTFEQSGNGIVFSVEVGGGKSAGFRVVYVQRCFDNSGCYILTTTSQWNRPLESAEFEITVTDAVNLEWCSYELTPAGKIEGMRTYEFYQKNFMPEKDLCFRWTVSPATGTSP
jgi:hypothetical protein